MKTIFLLFTLCLMTILLGACGQLDIAVVEETRAATRAVNGSTTDVVAERASPTPTATERSGRGDAPPASQKPTSTPEDAPTESTSEVSDTTPTIRPAGTSGEKEVPSATRTPQADGCAVRTDWIVYSVKRGDTLGRIASGVGATVDELAEANCLQNPDRLFSGQTLRVPRSPDPPTPTPTPTPKAKAHYEDSVHKAEFDYPATWRDVSDELMTRLAGDDGFVQLTAVSAPADLDRVAADEAFHKLRPYGSSPVVEPFTLSDGRQARLIVPSADQPPSQDRQAMIVAPYAEPIYIGEHHFNYLMLAADKDHILDIGASLTLPGATGDIGIDDFSVSAEALSTGGKRLTFRWSSHGANRGTITSGTAERFAPWWPVESVGELIVDVGGTIFADPVMTLRVVNDVSGQEAFETVVVPWTCEHQYFFEPGLKRCPRSAPLTVEGAFQPFEGGFMIWLPWPDQPRPSIYVFGNDRQLSLFPDTWSADDPANVPEQEPPAGLFQPVGGFGKVWRENPAVRDRLGWGTAEETLYNLTYQAEIRESIPGVAYLTRPDGTILRLMEITWLAYVPGQEPFEIGRGVTP